MDNQLLKYGAKDYFFRATLCRMCQEVEDATTTIGKYEEMFPAFSDSRECKLVKVRACMFRAQVATNIGEMMMFV